MLTNKYEATKQKKGPTVGATIGLSASLSILSVEQLVQHPNHFLICAVLKLPLTNTISTGAKK